MPDPPIHLFLPLLSSILLVSGFVLIKRTTTRGVSPWAVTFFANQWAALAFSFMWFLGGTGQPYTMLWQPATIACLYISGQVFTFLAINRGDVSVATPVLGIKVLIVPFLVMLLLHEDLPGSVWFAAAMAGVGIALVQWTGHHAVEHQKVLLTIVFAVAASTSFSLFDVLVQKWAPAWGAGRILPVIYWMVGIFSFALLPAVLKNIRSGALSRTGIRTPLTIGTLMIGLQAIFIVFTLSTFGDAARVNVVYALRSLWGVIFAWVVAVKWGGNEANLPKQVMVSRLCGAGLLTLAVSVTIIWK